MIWLFLLSLSAAAQEKYTVTNLGYQLGGFQYYWATGVNNNGQVSGYASDPGRPSSAFFWAGGVMTHIGTLPGGTFAQANGINKDGFLVGESQYSGGTANDWRAVMWNGVSARGLGTLPGYANSSAKAINDQAQVVGSVFTSFYLQTGPYRKQAFLWDNTQGMRGLGTLGGDLSEALGINNSGQVVGWSYTGADEVYAFLWDEANGMRNLNALGPSTAGGPMEQARAINNAGQVVGSANVGGIYRAFLWDATNGARGLGTPDDRNSEAYSINNSGEVVGLIGDFGSSRAFIWDSTNGLRDLNDLIPPGSGWVLEAAMSINDAGDIAGYGRYQGRSSAFILKKPTKATPLIFIPGIAGSSLDVKGGENLWLGGIYTDRSKLTLDPAKQQSDIVATDAIRKTTFASKPVEIYNSLLNSLVNTGGYHEYLVNNDPARRTAAGCDLTQQANNPNLFVFAYDWRKSNAENAVKLKEYVSCVQKFYPNTKVNILAHSMGGLLARRYILDNPETHNVAKLITIGSPWLGAPKAIYTLETGGFFANPTQPFYTQPGETALDYALGNTLKSLIEFFPGSHELLPSRWYFNLGGQPFAKSDGYTTQIYSFDQMNVWLNQQHPRSNPAINSILFHDNAGQDDWRNDQTGVQYYQFYGEQKREKTIGQYVAISKTYCLPFTNRCLCGIVTKLIEPRATAPCRSSAHSGSRMV